MIPNYQIIANLIPELKIASDGKYGDNDLLTQYSDLLQETLIRYIGLLEDEKEKTLQEFKNPVIWFREGIRFFLSIPVLVLQWVGIINFSLTKKIASSLLFTLLSGFITIITVLSSIASLVIGWDKLSFIMKEYFEKF